MMGKSPEALEDYSYGSGPLSRGKGWTTKVDPRILDVAGLPIIGAAGITKGVIAGKEALMSTILRKEGDVSRREFLKQAGTLAATSAAGAATPSIVKILSKGGAKEVAPAVAATGARSFVPAVVAGLKKWSKTGADMAGDIANTGVGGGPISDNFAAVANYLAENPQIFEKELTALTQKYGLRDNLMDDILGMTSPDMRKMYHEGTTESLANIEKWRADLPKSEVIDAHFKDPKNIAKYDEYFATGNLPKDAPEWYRTLVPYRVPNSLSGKLYETQYPAWKPEISGYEG